MTGADAATLLARLADAGLTVRADGADLVVSPGARLSAELRAATAAGKPAILAALSVAVPCPDCGGWCLRHPMRIKLKIDNKEGRFACWSCQASSSEGAPPWRVYPRLRGR